jgi:hypothetical protein
MSATLQSPYVVRITDFGETAAGLPYIVMEYVAGVTVHDYVQQHGRMRDIEVARVAMCVLRGLEEAHGRGIVHRDLKPSNIMLLHDPVDEDVVAKVTDFGIAKVVDELGELDEGPQTTGGMVFCTPQYAAPEVLMGTPNYQSDLYALGHTLAEMLDGSSPFVGLGAFEVANRQMSAEETPFGNNTRISKLWPVLRRACAKSLDDRYRTASEMLVDVDRVLTELRRSEVPAARPFSRLRGAPVGRAIDKTQLKRNMRADFGLAPQRRGEPSDDVTARVGDNGVQPLEPFGRAAQGNSVIETGTAPPISDLAAPDAAGPSVLIDPTLDAPRSAYGDSADNRPEALVSGAATRPGRPRDLHVDEDDPARSALDPALPDESDVSRLLDLTMVQPGGRLPRQRLTPRESAVADEVRASVAEQDGPGPAAPTERIDRYTAAAPAVATGWSRQAVVSAALAGALVAAMVTWLITNPPGNPEPPRTVEFSGAIIHDDRTASLDEFAESRGEPATDAVGPSRQNHTNATDTAARLQTVNAAVRAARVRVLAASTGMEPPATRPRYQWVTKPNEPAADTTLAVDAASRIGDEPGSSEPRFAGVPFPVAALTSDHDADHPPRLSQPARITDPDDVRAEPATDSTPRDNIAGDSSRRADREDRRRGFRLFRPRRLD